MGTDFRDLVWKRMGKIRRAGRRHTPSKNSQEDSSPPPGVRATRTLTSQTSWKAAWKFDTSLDRALLSDTANMNAFVLTSTVQICLFRSEHRKREEKQLPVAFFDFRYTKVFVAYWFPSNVQRSSKLRQIRAGFYLFNICKNHVVDHRPLGLANLLTAGSEYCLL